MRPSPRTLSGSPVCKPPMIYPSSSSSFSASSNSPSPTNKSPVTPIPQFVVEKPRSELHQTQPRTRDLEISSEQYLLQATLCIAIKISPQKPLHCVIFEGVGRTLFKRMQEEIYSFCAKQSLNRVYDLSIDYQAGTRPERCCSQAAFDKIFNKIILQRCNSFQVTALLSGTKCARTTITAWQRALDILTHQRIKKDNNKYIVRTGSWLEFCRDSSLLDSICCEQEEMREIFDDRTSFLDLKDNGIKLFAIFILVQRSNSAVVFRDFWNGGCRDADLPFVYLDQVTCCEDLLMWTALCDTQWQVMPIELKRIDKGVAPCRFLEDQVLPFRMGKILGKGGYATVFEITLDDDHSEIYEAFRACEFDVGKVCSSSWSDNLCCCQLTHRSSKP